MTLLPEASQSEVIYCRLWCFDANLEEWKGLVTSCCLRDSCNLIVGQVQVCQGGQDCQLVQALTVKAAVCCLQDS